MFLSAFRVLDGYLFHRNRYLCAMLLVLVLVAGANAAGAPRFKTVVLYFQITSASRLTQRRMRLADVRTKQCSQRWLFNPASCGKVGDLVIPHAANVEVSCLWVSQIETTDAGGGCHGQAFR